MIKFGTSDATSIFIGDKAVDKIYFGNDLKWQRTQPELLFVFTGIDANGNYELDANYDGTAVEYMLGDPYQYWKYVLVEPTPTEKSGYNSKYVYDETEQTYVQCTYTSSSDTLTPDWIEVGVTPAYTNIKVYSKDDEYDYTTSAQRSNNMFNYKYFENITASEFYGTNTTPPTLTPAIGNMVIPDTYKGKPVTKVYTYGFYYYYSPNSRNYPIMTPYNAPTSITLGANINELMESSFYIPSATTPYYTPSTFIFNNGLQKINASSLNNMFQTSSNIVFPSSVNYFGNGVTSKVATITLTGNFNSQCGSNGASVCDCADYAIINSTVTSITGYIACKSGTKLVFMHSANDPITLSLSKAKSAITTDIYTDNPTVQNYDWSTNANITPTFHPLSDYTGS